MPSLEPGVGREPVVRPSRPSGSREARDQRASPRRRLQRDVRDAESLRRDPRPLLLSSCTTRSGRQACARSMTPAAISLGEDPREGEPPRHEGEPRPVSPARSGTCANTDARSGGLDVDVPETGRGDRVVDAGARDRPRRRAPRRARPCASGSSGQAWPTAGSLRRDAPSPMLAGRHGAIVTTLPRGAAEPEPFLSAALLAPTCRATVTPPQATHVPSTVDDAPSDDVARARLHAPVTSLSTGPAAVARGRLTRERPCTRSRRPAGSRSTTRSPSAAARRALEDESTAARAARDRQTRAERARTRPTVTRDTRCLVPEQRPQCRLDPLLEPRADGRIGEREPRRLARLAQRVAERLERRRRPRPPTRSRPRPRSPPRRPPRTPSP